MHPRHTFRDRFPPNFPVVALVTFVIALLAWLAIVTRWRPMPGGAMGRGLRMSDPGVPEAMALSSGLAGAGLYLFTWGVTMIAMTYPSTVPRFRLYSRTLDGTASAEKAARVGAFMGTYALVWTATGIVPLVVSAAIPMVTLANAYGGYLLGGSLLLLSGYQLSSYKYRCLQQCRSPLGFLVSDHQPGVRGAVRMSWEFSVFCLGCCWALFAFMVVVSSMNVVWMAPITVVLSLERTVAWGERLARAVGVVAGFAGIVVVAITIL